MQSYIETLGRLIASRLRPPSCRARRMLTAAYSGCAFPANAKLDGREICLTRG